jgi:beta-lactamase class A
MRKTAFLLAVTFLATTAHAQLQTHLTALAAQAHGRVGIACSLPGTTLPCNVNAQEQLPMQSVYKLPIGLVALHAVEQGEFTLDTPFPLRAYDLWSQTTHSPLRDAHPHAGVQVPLRELLRLAVEQSDNVACDMLIRLLGGAQTVESKLAQLGFPNIHVRSTEQEVDRNDRLQYTNDASAAALLNLLVRLRDRSPLSPENTALLLGWMTTSPTGPARIKGLLPPRTVVAHKTGTGDAPRFVSAINDIGLITLPNGNRLALAVLIADSHVPVEQREHIIAEIARATYNAAVAQNSTASTSRK